MTSVSSSATAVAEQQAMPSADTIQQLQEAFSFVRHEREDVRKMAIRGIAAHSKENRDLWLFLASPQYGRSCIDSLLQYLHAGGKPVLGDILTILVNCSADGSCAEMLVQRKVVRKAMRLLDGMERSDQPEPYVRSVQELTLMLLNNLTSSHVTAIDDFLQRDDEDMRGFYLGKLQPKPASSLASSHRDLSRWILHILLNLTRTLDGQELLLEDEDWRGTLSSSLSSPNPRHRSLAAQCYRNCGCSPKPLYGLILKSDALVTAVDRLNCKEPIEDIQRSLAEFIASMLESEDGMARLESVNAKRFLQQSVLPYLEDIVDAYIAPGSDELD
ncbi:hypothetical protein CGC20_10370 [Leishmania donovani]|uniref:Uncharacterized protein n=1 Tax=Leishmania donovani TaxID=5661 RepID=A0A504YBL1_LEIDO|nr:hypothetical protein CGC20_10370 [Leishmania donovani]